jgi:replicative DNA helicase
LDVQKFEEWDGDTGIPGLSNNYKPLTQNLGGGGAQDGGRFFIQGSKMNGGEFDDDSNDDQPF